MLFICRLINFSLYLSIYLYFYLSIYLSIYISIFYLSIYHSIAWAGPCQDRLPKWYFDNMEKRCMPFYYGGCEGTYLYLYIIIYISWTRWVRWWTSPRCCLWIASLVRCIAFFFLSLKIYQNIHFDLAETPNTVYIHIVCLSVTVIGRNLPPETWKGGRAAPLPSYGYPPNG